MLVHLDQARQSGRPTPAAAPGRRIVSFAKGELNTILSLYSFQVSKGAWRDYAVDFTRDLAAFSMYRSAHEQPIAVVTKTPCNTASGFIFEAFYERKRIARAAELARVLNELNTLIAAD